MPTQFLGLSPAIGGLTMGFVAGCRNMRGGGNRTRVRFPPVVLAAAGCRHAGVGEPVGVKLEEIVGCRDEPPLGVCGGSASSREVIDPSVVFDLPVDRLDGDLAQLVERAAGPGPDLLTHPLVALVLPAWPVAAVAHRAVRRNEHLEPLVGELLDLSGMPVAGVA